MAKTKEKQLNNNSEVHYYVEKNKKSSKLFWANMVGLFVAFAIMPVATLLIYQAWGNPTWTIVVGIIASLAGIISVVQCNFRDWRFSITGFVSTMGWLSIGIWSAIMGYGSVWSLVVLQVSTLVIASWQTINWFLKKKGFVSKGFKNQKNIVKAFLAVIVLFTFTLTLNLHSGVNVWYAEFDSIGVALYKTGAWLMVFGNMWAYFLFMVSDIILSISNITSGVITHNVGNFLWGIALVFYAYLGGIGYLGAKESQKKGSAPYTITKMDVAQYA